MHTMKGSSSTLGYTYLANLPHDVEDLFYYIREKRPPLDFQIISDLILEVNDFFKSQISNIEDKEWN